MIYLIDYDRRAGRLVTLQTFVEAALQEALEKRLNLELALKHQGIDREIVILDAPNEQALRQTHGRYFKTIQELGQDMADAIR